MRFLELVVLPLTALTSSVLGHNVRRDGNSINASIAKISAQLTTLNNTLNTFTPGIAGTATALVIQGETTDLQNDVQSADNTVKASAPLSNSESSSVAFTIVGLTGKIYSVLDNIVRKKPAFDKAILGVGSASLLVKQDLINLKNATDQFGADLTVKFVPSVAKVAGLLIGAIDFHFDQAIKAYS